MVTKRRSSQVQGIDVERVAAAIQAAERRTSSEVRVTIARFYFWGDVRRAARATFTRLHMHRSQQRDGVLLFLAPRLRRFALVGDEGLRTSLADGFWQTLVAELAADFAGGDLTAGVERAIATLADHLDPTSRPAPTRRPLV